MRAESPPTKELRGSPARANRAVVSKRAGSSTEGDDNTDCARDNHAVADALVLRLGVLPINREIPSFCQNFLGAVLRFAEEGEAAPRMDDLAARAGMSVRHAQRARRACERYGWLRVEYRHVGPRENLPSVYEVLPTGTLWDRSYSLRAPRKLQNRRGLGGDIHVTVFSPSSTACRPGDRADAGGGLLPDEAAPPRGDGVEERVTSGQSESGHEGGVLRDDEAARDRAEVDALFAIVDDRTPQAQDGVVVSEGGTPEGGASAPSETARASEKTTPEVIREQMQACHLGDLCGAGFERKLWMLGIRKKLALPDLLAVIAIVGSKRQAAIFDANGGETKFQGDPSLVRGYVFRCIENQRLPKPVVLREPERRIPRLGSAGALYGSDRRAHGGPPMEERSLSDCARRIHDALRAEYHGEKPLADIATPQLAMHLAQRSEDAACGGTLTTDDVVETLRAYATNLAFKLKRHDVIPTPGALKAFVTKEVREAKRGCAATLKPRTDAAKFYPARQRIDTRQPGTTMDHLRVPTPEITPAEMDELKDIFK